MISRRKFLGQLGAAAIIPSGMLALPPGKPKILCYTLNLERVEAEGQPPEWRLVKPDHPEMPHRRVGEQFGQWIEAQMKGGQRVRWHMQYRPV